MPLLLLRPTFFPLKISVTAINKVRSGGVYRNAAFFRQMLPKISRISAIFRQGVSLRAVSAKNLTQCCIFSAKYRSAGTVCRKSHAMLHFFGSHCQKHRVLRYCHRSDWTVYENIGKSYPCFRKNDRDRKWRLFPGWSKWHNGSKQGRSRRQPGLCCIVCSLSFPALPAAGRQPHKLQKTKNINA